MTNLNMQRLPGLVLLGGLLLGFMLSCGSDKSAKKPAAGPADTAVSIADQLTARREGFQAKAPAAALAITREAVEAIKNSGLLDSALNVGDTIPRFSLPDAVGTRVNISDLLKKGPVVLVFYRGTW